MVPKKSLLYFQKCGQSHSIIPLCNGFPVILGMPAFYFEEKMRLYYCGHFSLFEIIWTIWVCVVFGICAILFWSFQKCASILKLKG